MEHFKGLWRRMREDPQGRELAPWAGAGAYYLFLSLGPLTALLLAALPYTSLPEEALADAAAGVAPPALGTLLNAIASDIYAAPGPVLGISLLLELWSGAKVLSYVVRVVSVLSRAEHRGFFRQRLLGAGYTLLLMVFLLLHLALLLDGRRPAGLRALLLLPGLTAANALLYQSPPGKQPALPGAAAAALLWLGFTRLYTFALERFGLFGVYGSIAAVTATLFWAYCSLYILFLGAWMNRFFPMKKPARRFFRPRR